MNRKRAAKSHDAGETPHFQKKLHKWRQLISEIREKNCTIWSQSKFNAILSRTKNYTWALIMQSIVERWTNTKPPYIYKPRDFEIRDNSWNYFANSVLAMDGRERGRLLVRQYDYKDLVKTYIETNRKNHVHQDFEQYFALRLKHLQQAFGVSMQKDAFDFKGRVLWQLFESTVDSYLRILHR